MPVIPYPHVTRIQSTESSALLRDAGAPYRHQCASEKKSR
ncbi:hypothetical protein BBJK_00170 [Bifidobacterium bifidum LMG 13195]|uniref:Uncharacterized protein n=1 Tax=Bifidobacterium bifidum LMG 13195 TaxID=1207542 RepID=A0A286T9V0_BIFBI|nr:hypothetical protein BIFBIF_00524 [Bifidobacterium bifidum ATCC 29521 = JCM 1255 = DSM 20456]BBA47163.1 hypothetical protein BBJK_00170 [Bifidobacterium bifidum LMG 13195]